MRILIIEDEHTLADNLAHSLRQIGYAVDVAYDGAEGYQTALINQSYDLLVLDLNLPHMDGLEILKKLRQQFPQLLIIILTARTTPQEKITGLDLGADDYLTKPFHQGELTARIRALLRRDQREPSPLLTHQEIKFDPQSRAVWLNKIPLTLTKKETAILEYFLRNKHKLISQEELLQHIWNDDANPFTNVIRVHINSLRKKLSQASPSQNPYIITKIGEGYQLTPDPSTSSEEEK